jgi:hypothetical protein
MIQSISRFISYFERFRRRTPNMGVKPPHIYGPGVEDVIAFATG